MKHHWECIFQRDPRNPLLEEEESLFRFNSMPYYVYSQDMILLFHSKERGRRRRREGSSFKEDLSIPSLLVLSLPFFLSLSFSSSSPLSSLLQKHHPCFKTSFSLHASHLFLSFFPGQIIFSFYSIINIHSLLSFLSFFFLCP